MKQFSDRRVIFFLVLVLLGFMLITAFMVSYQQKELLRKNIYYDHQGDASLIADAALEPLLKLDYVSVRNFVKQWGNKREEFHELRIVGANGFVIAEYRSPEAAAGETYSLTKDVVIEQTKLATIHLKGDYHEADILAVQLRNRLVLAGLIITTLLGASLWYIFRRMAIEPLEEEINERKKAENKLTESTHFLQTLIDAIPNPIFYKNINSVYTGCNAAFEAYIGMRKSEIIGKSVYDIAPQKLAVKYNEMDMELFRTGGFQAYEASVRYSDGTLHDVIFNKAIFTNADGSLGGLVGVMLDITGRKNAEEALRKNEELFRSLVEQSPLAIAVINKTGRIEYINRKHTDLAGYTVEDIPTIDAWWALAYQDKEMRRRIKTTWLDITQAIFSGRSVEPVERTIVCRDGSKKDVELRFSLAGENILTIFYDITGRRQLEDQLRQSQKMESIGTFAGGIAHDFNNILSAILGYGEMSLMNLSEGDPNLFNLEQIMEAGRRAVHLTKDLLLFSRKQQSDRKPIDLNETIERSKNFLTRVIGEDISLKTMLCEEEISIFADPHQIEQILMNIATNARDAMSKGGVLSVTTEQVMIDEHFIKRHGYGKPGKYAMVTVSDTGVGMDETTRQKIFEPFYTTKEAGKGTGLGLAVVYGIVKQHDGFISVYSGPGAGATFKIYFPVIAAGGHKEKADALYEQPAGGTEVILLAEDEDSVRDLTTTVLEHVGYSVITAVDGEDAVNKYHENKDRIKMLLFDIIMPKKSGKEAYDEIRTIDPSIKILFVSGYSPDIVMNKASLESGASIVYKPISPLVLLKKIRSVLDEDKG